ncbi:circadian clock KaiB family protein [Streptosporangium sp. NPDC087985]|uniref:circadian clock KaiB family protein n=1 Tax=Streptosporangium sp. NPDC087985 TaxID=3366196 RepID=UPI00380AA7FE
MAVLRSVVTYSFRLYVVGQTPRSLTAVANLRVLCETYLPGCHEIEVIDAAERPDLAEEERILATPTVIRIKPPPRFRVIGDLSDQGQVAAFLDLPGVDRLSPQGGAQ